MWICNIHIMLLLIIKITYIFTKKKMKLTQEPIIFRITQKLIEIWIGKADLKYKIKLGVLLRAITAC